MRATCEAGYGTAMAVAINNAWAKTMRVEPMAESLTFDQWQIACDVLNADIAAQKNLGIIILASFCGAEPSIAIDIESEDMNWVVANKIRPLSEQILADNDDPGEVEMIADGLRTTIAKLEEWLRAADKEAML